jgi:CBS domain-containing protein
MLRLSALLRAPVRDETGQASRLVDLAVDLSVADYPAVTEVLLPGKDGEVCALSAPVGVTPRGGLIVPKLAPSESLSADALAHRVLLARDVLDALVLDVAGERAVRANDLWLRPTPDGLALAGADVSPWAVIRRLSRGWLGRGGAANVLDWRDVEYLRGDPRAAVADHDEHRRVCRLGPVQLARLTDALPYLHAAELVALLPPPLAADVLEHMLPERQAQVILELDDACATRLLAEMAADAAADLLGHLDVADATRLLERVPPERGKMIQDLLRYPPDSAGGIMTNEIVTAPVGLSASAVLTHVRAQLARPDFVYFIYLVDDEQSRRLAGVTTLRDLHLADPATPVAAVMRTGLVTVGPLDSAVEAARRVWDSSLNAIPVVAADRTLLGIVTIDKAMAQIAPPAWRDNLPRIYS